MSKFNFSGIIGAAIVATLIGCGGDGGSNPASGNNNNNNNNGNWSCFDAGYYEQCSRVDDQGRTCFKNNKDGYWQETCDYYR